MATVFLVRDVSLLQRGELGHLQVPEFSDFITPRILRKALEPLSLSTNFPYTANREALYMCTAVLSLYTISCD